MNTIKPSFTLIVKNFGEIKYSNSKYVGTILITECNEPIKHGKGTYYFNINNNFLEMNTQWKDDIPLSPADFKLIDGDIITLSFTIFNGGIYIENCDTTIITLKINMGYKVNSYFYNGGIYNGQIFYEKPNGKGNLVLAPNPFIRELSGLWDNGDFSSSYHEQKIFYTNDDIYIGYVNNNVRHGPGTLYTNNKPYKSLKCIWDNNMPDTNKSVDIIYQDGSSYSGFIYYEYGIPKRHGSGILINKLGTIKTVWNNDIPSKEDTEIIYPDGSNYKGGITEDYTPDGRGCFENSNYKYTGNYTKGKKHSHRIYYDKNKKISFDGLYTNDKMEYGTLTTFLKKPNGEYDYEGEQITITTIWNKPGTKLSIIYCGYLYEGNLLLKDYSGYCTIKDPNTEEIIYEGNIKNNFQKTGYGSLYKINVHDGKKYKIYTKWQDDALELDNCKITFEDSVFEGKITNLDMLEGYGELTYNDGVKFFGKIRYGKEMPHIKRTIISETEHELEHPKLGKLCVKYDEPNTRFCTIEYDDMTFKGIIYTEDFEEVLKGTGEIFYQCGVKYTGDMTDFKRDGNGQLDNIHPVIGPYSIITTWTNDRMPTTLVMQHNNISCYITLKDIKTLSGYGSLIYPDGSRYIGNIKHFERNGKGRSIMSYGFTLTGKWKNDRCNGTITIYKKYSDSYHYSVWKNGVQLMPDMNLYGNS